jgi:UDP-N-acetylglucosamine/UDP-N-acetylgalactosamine 4-epimerase
MYKQSFHTEDLKNKSFLVTGGAGFIGSNIAEYLLKYGAGKVRVLDNLSTGFFKNIKPFKSNSNFEFIEGDICNYQTCVDACKKIDFVIHQAALGSVPRSVEFPLNTHASNTTGFLNMLNAAKESKVERFVYASSSSVYGDSHDLPKTENHIGRPLSPYAVSKLVDELYAEVFNRIYKMEVIGLRYFNIYGPRQDPSGPYAAAIPLFMKALIENKSPVIFGDGEQSRDFTFVENAVQANIKAVFTKEAEALGQVFNIAVGERISVNSLFSILKKNIGSSVIPNYVEERRGDIKHSLADISRAKTLLGYSPQIKIEEGLKITLNWFKKSNL